MNIQAHKLSLIGTLLDVNDAQLLSRVETFLKAEISAAHEKEIVPMTMEEYRAEIERSLEDYRAGRYTSHEDLKKEMLTW
jgi:isopentenyldiphosphate isomerase